MDNKKKLLDAMYCKKKNQFGFDESMFMEYSYLDIKNKAFNDMSLSEYQTLVAEMVNSKMIYADLKDNGKIVDGTVSVLRNGIEYYANKLS